MGTRHIFVTASCCFIDVSRITVVFFGGIFPTSSPFRVTRYTWYVVRNNNTQSYSLLRRFPVFMSTRTVGNCIQISSFVYALNVGNSRHIFVASSDKEFFFLFRPASLLGFLPLRQWRGDALMRIVMRVPSTVLYFTRRIKLVHNQNWHKIILFRYFTRKTRFLFFKISSKMRYFQFS